MPRLLYFIAACNLVIGTGAFGLSGILQPVAQSLGVGVAAAGQSMTAYAMATALCAPLLLVATGRWSRLSAVQLALGLFALGLMLCAAAPNLQVLLAGRVLMGLGAMFTAIGASIAVTIVAPARQGKALSLAFLGMSLSYVIGLPLAAWAGMRLGWRVPTLGIGIAALLMLVLMSRHMPRTLDTPGATFVGLGSVVRQGEVLRPLLLTLLYFTAIFTQFSYIGPVLLALEPMSPERLSLTLVIFGFAGVAGTLTGGWATDRFGAVPTLRVQLAVLVLSMLLVPLTRGHYGAMLAVFVVSGMAGFGMMAPTQARLVSASARQAPMLLSLNASMLYFGSAIGAAVGGAASGWVGFDRLAWVGAVFAAFGGLCLVQHRKLQQATP